LRQDGEKRHLAAKNHQQKHRQQQHNTTLDQNLRVAMLYVRGTENATVRLLGWGFLKEAASSRENGVQSGDGSSAMRRNGCVICNRFRSVHPRSSPPLAATAAPPQQQQRRRRRQLCHHCSQTSSHTRDLLQRTAPQTTKKGMNGTESAFV